MKKQEFRYTTLWKEDDDEIIFASYAPKLEANIEIAQELVENRMNFSENKAHYALIDITNLKSITKEARDYMNAVDGGLKGLLGGAFVSTSIATNMLVNLYMQINKPAVPAKFFTKREEALNWLKGLKATRGAQ